MARGLVPCAPFLLLLMTPAWGQDASNDPVQSAVARCKHFQAALGETNPLTEASRAAAASCTALQSATQAADREKAKTAALEAVNALDRLKQPEISPQEDFKLLDDAAAGLTGLARFYKLIGLAKLAFEAGEIDRAQTLARELLQMAPEYRKDWNYGNAIYYGYFVLGRVALHQGNLALAVQYLMDAGSTPGSPQLNSFGPNVTLAKELLEKGQNSAVLQFFAACKNFWKLDRGLLDQWSATVRRGGMPEFNANLHY